MGEFFTDFFQGTDGNGDAPRRLTDLLPSIVYIYDLDNKKLNYVNKAVTDLLGYEFDEIKNWDDHFSKLVFKDDEEMVRKELARYSDLKGEESHTYDCRLNQKSGLWKYFRTKGTVLKRDESGKAKSILFIAEDISHQVESAELIEAKMQLITEIEQILDFGTWSWDAVTGKMEWSAGLYGLLGYRPEDFPPGVSQDFYLQHVSHADLGGLTAKIKWSIENKTGFEDIHTITTAGTNKEKILSSKSKAVLSDTGKLIKMIGTVRDVTDQITAQKDLIYHRQLTLGMEQFLESGTWETDMKTGISSWSEGMYRLFGYDPSEELKHLILDEDFFLSHLPEKDVEKAKADWRMALKNQEDYVSEFVIHTHLGKTRLLETFGKIIRDKSGEPIRVVGATKDITRLKRYEKELEKKVSDLERSNAELEEFAYVASHDLQEPLRKISIFSERLKNMEALGSGQEASNYLSRMISATENMRLLIDNLLEFSRVTRMERHYEETDLNKVLAEAIADLEIEIEESHTVIQSGDLPVIQAVPVQIKQLMTNLLMNGLKFRKGQETNQITIRSRSMSEEEIMHFQLLPGKGYYEISITDNGIGFDQQYAERIFQIFTRLNARAEFQGTGIGLAICKKIVDSHGGRIYARSSQGKGSIFFFILPQETFEKN